MRITEVKTILLTGPYRADIAAWNIACLAADEPLWSELSREEIGK